MPYFSQPPPIAFVYAMVRKAAEVQWQGELDWASHLAKNPEHPSRPGMVIIEPKGKRYEVTTAEFWVRDGCGF